MTEIEKNVFGVSIADIREYFLSSVTGRVSGPGMVAISVLSDAQHVLEHGDAEQARKYMNIAKYIISEELMGRNKKEAA